MKVIDKANKDLTTKQNETKQSWVESLIEQRLKNSSQKSYLLNRKNRK